MLFNARSFFSYSAVYYKAFPFHCATLTLEHEIKIARCSFAANKEHRFQKSIMIIFLCSIIISPKPALVLP